MFLKSTQNIVSWSGVSADSTLLMKTLAMAASKIASYYRLHHSLDTNIYTLIWVSNYWGLLPLISQHSYRIYTVNWVSNYWGLLPFISQHSYRYNHGKLGVQVLRLPLFISQHCYRHRYVNLVYKFLEISSYLLLLFRVCVKYLSRDLLRFFSFNKVIGEKQLHTTDAFKNSSTVYIVQNTYTLKTCSAKNFMWKNCIPNLCIALENVSIFKRETNMHRWSLS